MDKIRKFDHSNTNFPMVLDIMLYNVGLPFASVDEIPKFSRVKKRRRQYNLLILSKVKDLKKSLDYLVMRY